MKPSNDKRNSAGGILNRLMNGGKPVHLEVPRDYDPYAEPVTPDYNLRGDPSLSEIDDSDTQKTTTIVDEHFPWLQSIYDREPIRKGDLTTHQLLARIADLLSQSRQVDVPSDFMRVVSFTIPANVEREIPVTGLTQYGYLYIPPQAVALTFSYGLGRGQPIGTVPANTSAYAVIPHIDTITVVCPSNPTAYNVVLYPSTRPFSFDVNSSDTSGAVASEMMIFNGTEFVPAESGTGAAEGSLSIVATFLTLTDNSNINSAGELGIDGIFKLPASAPFLFNGITWDRPRGTTHNTVLTSAARTVSTNSIDQTNHNAAGAHIIIDVTAIALTPSITVTVEGKDQISGKYYDILESVAITAVGTTVLRIYPGLTPAASTVANDVLPRTWRVSVVNADADSITYGVNASLVL